MTDQLELLAALFVAHFICDYPLQGDFLAKAKNPAQPIPDVPWGWAMSAHCAIHAGAVVFITMSLLMGVVEFVAHFAIDVAKCRGRITFSQDQWWHIATKCLIGLAMVVSK